VWNTRHTMDRDVIRRHAFGTYTDMLLASARNPAMLRYLNLAESDKKLVNENYGRELLELHTVGLGAGYSEADVANSARILTGRTLDKDFNYTYVPAKHWVGPITVMTFHHDNATAADGEAAGELYVRHLASHPATAARIARKLCIRFVSDAPSAALVATVAQAYTASGTAILPTVKAILSSAEFWASTRKKVRRPAENLLATIRLLGLTPGTDLPNTLSTLHWMTQKTGNIPLDWAPPNGYPDVAASWRSSGTLLDLWQYHRGLVQNWWPTAFSKLDVPALYGTATPATSGAAIDALAVRLIGTTLPTAHSQALQTFLGEPASTPLAKSQLRWNLGHLVPLILDAPHHALR